MRIAPLAQLLQNAIPGPIAQGVWQRFATDRAIRALTPSSTWKSEKRLRLSAGAREKTDPHPASSPSRPAEFAIRRQSRTRFAFRENPTRERRTAEHAGNAGLQPPGRRERRSTAEGRHVGAIGCNESLAKTRHRDLGRPTFHLSRSPKHPDDKQYHLASAAHILAIASARATASHRPK